MSFRKDIEGLRGVAVALVIVFHFFEDALPLGYLGVDMFFVISGFVVTLSLLKAYNQDHSISSQMSLFFSKRVRRILPPLYVALLMWSIFFGLLVPDSEDILWTASAAIFGGSNILLSLQTTDYFGLSQKLNPFTHTWSLGVEEQFYLSYALIFIFGLQYMKINRFRWLLSGLTLGSLILFILSPLGTNWSFYMLPSRFWQIASGAILAISTTKLGFTIKNKSWLPSYNLSAGVGAILIVMSLAYFPHEQGATAAAWLPNIMMTVGVLLTIATPTRWGRRVLESRCVRPLGSISYSAYLHHWPLAVLLRWTELHEHFAWKIAGIFASLGLGFVSYSLIEKGLCSKLQHNSKTIMIILTISAALAALIGITMYASETLYKDKTGDFQLWYSVATPTGKIIKSDCQPSKKTILLKPQCSIKQNEKAPTIYLLGDSHAYSMVPSLVKFAEQHKVNLDLKYGWACYLSTQSHRKGWIHCAEYYQKALEHIQAHASKDDLIIISGFFLRGVLQGNSTTIVSTVDGSIIPKNKQHEMQKKSWTENLKTMPTQVLIIPRPFPTPKAASLCLSPLGDLRADCLTFKLSEQQRSNYESSLYLIREIAGQLHHVSVGTSTWDLYCSESECEVAREGRSILADGTHMTITTASSVIEESIRRIDWQPTKR